MVFFHLHQNLQLPVIPIAGNIGLCRPRRVWRKRSGRAVKEFLPPIPPGYDRKTFMEKLGETIETATVRLLEEGR